MRADVRSCISLLIRSSRILLARVNVHILFTESSKAFRSKSMRRSVSTVNWHATSAHRFPRIRGWKRRLVARRANFLAAIDWFKYGQWPYGSAVFLLTSVHRVVFEKKTDTVASVILIIWILGLVVVVLCCESLKTVPKDLGVFTTMSEV